MIKEQGDLIKQLEADLLNVRGLQSSLYRGEGVGAPSTPTDSELIIKAVQDINSEEGMFFNVSVAAFEVASVPGHQAFY